MFKRERRYLVMKGSDMAEALTENEQDKLATIARGLDMWRRRNGKADLDCFVVEADWPEFPVVIDMVRRRMEGLPTREAEYAGRLADWQKNYGTLKQELAKYTEASANKTDWCPVCKQGWDCHTSDQQARVSLHEAERTMRDLAMMVKLLCRKSPDAKKVTAYMDYLQRKGLQGSPLRAEAEPKATLPSAYESPLEKYNRLWLEANQNEIDSEAIKTALGEAISEALGEAYDCGRVWEAWGIGTMSEDDFTLVAEGPERISEMVAAVMAVIHPLIAAAPDKAAFEKVAVEFFYWWHNQPGNNTAEGFNKWWESREAQAPSDLTQTKSPLTPKHLIGLMQIGLNLSPEAVQRVQATIDRWELKPAPAWRKEPPEAAGGWWYWNCDPEDRPMRVDVVMRSYGGEKRAYILQFSDWAANHEGGMWLREIEPTVPVLEGKADAKTNA